jgi:hypothetical protein
VVWLYHSYNYEGRDTNVDDRFIIAQAGYGCPDGTPKDVDREFVTLFHHRRKQTVGISATTFRLTPPTLTVNK